jgi:hypothetical protein
MKHFAYFIAGILVASFAQTVIAPAQAGGNFLTSGMEEGRRKNQEQYEQYVKCRDKNPKVVTYECLRLYPGYGLKNL